MNFLNIKYKLIPPSIALIVLTLILSFMILSQNLTQKKNYELTKQYILVSSAISKVIHYMQIERGLSNGFLAKNALDKPDAELLLIKEELNKAINNAKYIYQNKQISKERSLLKLLSEIETTRKNMDLRTKSTSYIEEYYSQKIEELIDYTVVIPTLMDDRQNRNFIQAFVYLSTAKESLGIIRATLNKVFIEDAISQNDYLTIKESLKKYHKNINIFKETVTEDFLKQFENIFKSKSIDNTFDIIINIIADAKLEKKLTTKPDYWFEQSSQTINLLNSVENTLFSHINEIINGRLSSIFYKLVLISFLSIIAIIVLISITVVVIKNILVSANKLSVDYTDSLSLLEQYKSSVDRSFIVSKTDKNGIITYANDEFCKISGYSKEELIGKSHNIIRHPDTDKSVFKELWHTIRDKKEPWFGDIKNQAKDKTPYWTKAIINPIIDSNGDVMEYIAIRTDVTELENAMIAALSAEKATSAFLATMSHELRTPLNAVIGFSQILMAKDDMPQEKIRTFIEKINVSGKHLLNIVNNILDFSKIESGMMNLNKREILLNNFINDTTLLVENEALKKDIKIIKKDFFDIALTADEQLLKQVVLNILSNAIKFSNQNSAIYISYKKDEENHIISICDEGVGLSQEQLEKLFKPFSQIQEHQNSAIKGTGLGLVISQKIIELHNGKIEVESEINRGSCFNIYLPIIKG